MAFLEIESDPLNSEMDPESEEGLMGLSRASLKKYSSPARRRILARQAAAAAKRGVGFSNPLSAAKKAIKRATSKLKKKTKAAFTVPKKYRDQATIANLNKLAKVVGPVAAAAAPQYAPAINTSMAVIDAADKGDMTAMAEIAATEAAAQSGDPDAIAAMQMYQVAKTMKTQQDATLLLTAAQAGDPAAVMKLQAIQQAKASNPEAAASYEALVAARNGQQVNPQALLTAVAAKKGYDSPTEMIEAESEEAAREYAVEEYGNEAAIYEELSDLE